jgi:hypothetical protein
MQEIERSRAILWVDYVWNGVEEIPIHEEGIVGSGGRDFPSCNELFALSDISSIPFFRGRERSIPD